MPSTSKAKTSWMVDQQMPLESFGISMSSKQRQKQKGRQPKENKTPATPANNTRSKRKGDHDELHPVKKLKATGRGVVESSMGKSEFASQDSTLGRTTRSRKALKDITICQDGHPIISEQTGKSRLTNNMQSLRGRALSESSSTTSLTGSDVIDVDDWAIITTNAKTDVSVEPLSIFDPTPKRPLPTHIQGSFGLPTPPMSSHPFNRIRRVSPLVDGDGDEIVPDSQASSSTTFTQGTAWKKPLVSSRSMGQSDYPTPVTGRMARTESRVLVDVGRVKDLFGPPSSPVTHSTANHTLNTESPPFGLMLPPHPDVDALSSNSDACDVPSSQSQYLVPFVVTPKRSRLSDFPDMHDELDDATEKGSKEWESVVPTSQSDEMELSAYKVIPSRILTPTAPEIGYHSPSHTAMLDGLVCH
ncbi:hypothetical protein BD410DRAFT_2080 [Rickenella mellea]|uniref:Uncharacterized protein n=1 Tax=Rickenella mellea TaxID=50990 RepID=A0A4R5XE88_9AGAM|nr:hypothetical protein BD410DRAFT_2080 [Rickenella mellea]